jgi:septation ring formation regulator EzrA
MILLGRLFLAFILFTSLANDVMAQQKAPYSAWLNALKGIESAIKEVEKSQEAVKDNPQLAKEELEAARKVLTSIKNDLDLLKGQITAEHKKKPQA